MTRLLDVLAVAEHDKTVAQVLGLVLSGCLVLLWAALRLTTPKGA